MNEFRSLKHIYAQVIDDDKGITLAAASSLEKDFEGKGGNIAAAKAVGAAIAKKLSTPVSAKSSSIAAVISITGELLLWRNGSQ